VHLGSELPPRSQTQGAVPVGVAGTQGGGDGSLNGIVDHQAVAGALDERQRAKTLEGILWGCPREHGAQERQRGAPDDRDLSSIRLV